MESTVRTLEQEQATLLKDLRSSEQKRSEVVTQCKEEIKVMNLQINELRRTDSKNPHLMHQIATLESLLYSEQEKNERLTSEMDLLRGKLQQMSDVEQQLLPHNIAERNHHNGSIQLQSAIHAELESMRRNWQDTKPIGIISRTSSKQSITTAQSCVMPPSSWNALSRTKQTLLLT